MRSQQPDVPVLFLNGEWDEYTAAEDARLFGNHVAQSTFTTLQATGHFLDMEQPDTLAKLIVQFAAEA